MIRFEEDEYILLAMFRKENRQETIENIQGVIPYIGRDEEIISLLNSILEKLPLLSDEAFLNLSLADCRQEPKGDE